MNNYERFRADMEAAGYEVVEYHGRNFYRGPAVNTSRSRGITEQDIYRATAVRLQRDQLGLNSVLYPYPAQEEA